MLAEVNKFTTMALRMHIAPAQGLRDEDRHAWQRLAQRASEPNPFHEHWFLGPALEHLRDGNTIWLATAWAGEELVGVLPLSRRANYGRTPIAHLGNWLHYQCFMGAPLIARGFEHDFWHALIRELDGADWAQYLLSFAALDEQGPVHAGLIEAATALGRPSPVVHRFSRALLAGKRDTDTYLAAVMRPKKRKELRRLANRLAELGTVGFRTLDDRDELDGWCADFLALEAAGWKGTRGAAMANTPQTIGFFKSVLLGAFEADRLDFQRLDLDGRPIAMLINFLTPPGAWSFKIAYDENLARFSPGVMIELENLPRVLGNGAIDWMDSCAVENHPMIESLWAERRSIVQISVPLAGWRRGIAWRVCRIAENTAAWLRARLKPETVR